MEERHREQGLVLLAVNLDASGTRPKVPAFLKKYGIRAKVLLGSPEELQGYNTRVASSLYVIDRKGFLAGVPSEFYLQMGKKVEARLPGLLAGKPTPGPVLWTLETGPPGLGILWRQDSEANAEALAVVPASGKHPAEIGIVDRSDLKRYSPTGKLLGDAPLEGENLYYLRGADLDGNGKTEWIAGGDGGFSVVDAAGEEYWAYRSFASWSRVVAILDLEKDGRSEIVVQDGSSVIAQGPFSELLWKAPPGGPIRSVIPDPLGVLLVQRGSEVQALDGSGRLRGSSRPAGVAAALMGRVDLGGGRALDVFGPTYNVSVDVEHDLDGDGNKDILVSGMGGVAVYSLEGSPLLILKITNNQGLPRVAIADLDGRPGDELILAIPDYGLVALGVSPEAGLIGSGSPE